MIRRLDDIEKTPRSLYDRPMTRAEARRRRRLLRLGTPEEEITLELLSERLRAPKKPKAVYAGRPFGPGHRQRFERPMTQTERWRYRMMQKRGVNSNVIQLSDLDDRHWIGALYFSNGTAPINKHERLVLRKRMEETNEVDAKVAPDSQSERPDREI